MAKITRSAESVWHGTGKDGEGAISSNSGALEKVPYALNKRFGDAPGTNPEELIGAAHAGCYNMALAVALGNAGFTPDTLHTTAYVTIKQQENGWRITTVKLVLVGKVPGISAEDFHKTAKQAKDGCPVSNALNAEISIESTLE